MSIEHESLVTQALSGEPPAVQSLLIRHLPKLEAYVRLKAGAAVRSRESLSDVVQSVCVEVLRDAGTFEYRGEPEFTHWLCRQALHKIINKQQFHTAAKRDLNREITPRDDQHSYLDCYRTVITPSQVAVGREHWEAFEAAFDQLPDDYREAVTLRRVVGLSYADIATQTGRSEGAVRNLVYRGIARLSTLLDKQG
jgi:RNA polymerase sigma-70 factor (ECF subfamily)